MKKNPLRWKGIGGRKSKKLKAELMKPIPLELMKNVTKQKRRR